MGVSMTDGVLDALLDKMALGTRITILSAEPLSILNITTTYKLGSLALTAGDGNGDFVKANGDVSGRKLTVLAQNIPITATGTATHVAIDDDVDFVVTTCNSKAWTSGDTAQASAFDTEVPDPVAA